jgi:hypothetical protein
VRQQRISSFICVNVDRTSQSSELPDAAAEIKRSLDKGRKWRAVKHDAHIIMKRLGVAAVLLAQEAFRRMAEVFDEGLGALSEGYVTPLLGRTVFWAMAALQDTRPIGRITAQQGWAAPGRHSLPRSCRRTRRI